MNGEAVRATTGVLRGEDQTTLAGAAVNISLLTGGDDLSYALGLTEALAERGVIIDYIGSDAVYSPVLDTLYGVRFINLRGDQSHAAPMWKKVLRIVRYYIRLLMYAVSSRPRLFHILWNNKFQHFDRTVLMLWYRITGHHIVLTAHNVNAARRDGHDNAFNRLTLRAQYQLCRTVFVHTQRMADELHAEFGLPRDRIAVVPFGINKAFPDTDLTPAQARARLGIAPEDRVMLFFGQIAPYKGLEYLVDAMPRLVSHDPRLKLVIAGKVKVGSERYWAALNSRLEVPILCERVVKHIAFVPEGDVEVFFKAADLLVMPYVHIFQSGVPFLAYGYGLPVVAADVGALRDDIEEGLSGYVCQPCDSNALAAAVERYFCSAIYRQLPTYRVRIRKWAEEGHSWRVVGEITESVYRRALFSGNNERSVKPT